MVDKEKLINSIKKKHRVTLNLIIGKAGSGKTSAGARIAQKAMRKGQKVYSNVPIKGTLRYEKEDIGKYDISGTPTCPTVLILDEAGLEYDNRNFAKNFSDKSLYWWKFFRHFNVQIYIFSQTADIDLKLRALADGYYLVRNTPFKQFTFMQYAVKEIGINKETQQLEDHYRLIPMKYKILYTRPARKLFDTYEHANMPVKNWEKWA